MQPIPTEYHWLYNLGRLPLMLEESLRHHGTLEHKGRDNNPSIMAWSKELGESVSDVYIADEIPWCGLYIGMLAKRSRYEVVKNPLWALNWGTFGVRVDQPKLGDVCTFIRTTSEGKRAGHVALYVAQDRTGYLVHGGNQQDSVCFTWIAKDRLYAACRPIWKIGPPASRRIYFAKRNGDWSRNEQ
jgi:uncharacterized protein (TIGR02594 family)